MKQDIRVETQYIASPKATKKRDAMHRVSTKNY